MAGSSKQKKQLATTMSMYFAEAGWIVDPKSFSEDPNRPTLIKMSTIRKIFGSWSIMIKFTQSFCPALMRGLTEEKPKVETPTPLEELQAKTASPAEDEGVDGKGI
tara:strand:- start:2642 stop:2959 length:318 start_codon:yes stop_codon:yes gene_type:complete